MEDKLILVDTYDAQIGVASKLETHRMGLLHRAFSVFLVDSEGRLLLQRRAQGKYHSGGLWANSCCSHPRDGEELLPAAQRRVREELGVSGVELRELGAFVYRREFADGLCEYEYDHVLLGEYSGALEPDPEEISECRWISQEQLTAELCHRPEKFAAWFITAVPIVLRELSRDF